MPLCRPIYLLFSVGLLTACAEPVLEAPEAPPIKVEVQSNISELSIVDFIGDYSVYGTCPQYDWNTGILTISEDYISITETGCKISTATASTANVLILDLTACHAEGEPMPDERTKLTMTDGLKTLQYLPNADGIQSGDGRVFQLTPCSRDKDQ